MISREDLESFEGTESGERSKEIGHVADESTVATRARQSSYETADPDRHEVDLNPLSGLISSWTLAKVKT